jgi:uncharacterized protein YndB with AHSA1/START domain
VPDILHKVGIAASPARVFQHFSTKEGLSEWWTRDTRGNPGEGGTLQFVFGDEAYKIEFQVVSLQPDESIQWHCVDGPSEWIGTDVYIQLKPMADETLVYFRHADWREPVEFMHHCSTKWATFLLSLRAAAEGTGGRPFPDDLRITVGER